MNDIIEKIIEKTYARYGKHTYFREYEFKYINVNKTTALYRVRTPDNSQCMYHIQLYVFNHVKLKNGFHLLGKCVYCNKHKTNYKFTCCNKSLHFQCGLKNNFACCHLKKHLANAEKNTCCVCLEDTHSITECGHHLCLHCLIEIYKTSGVKFSIDCPMCRNVITQDFPVNEYKNISVNGNEEMIMISMI
jgi:hypothetical protein